MNPAELLSRLNPSIPDINSLPSGWGGLSPSDIAASLAGLPRPAQLVLLSRWACFAGLESEILYYTLNYTVKLWVQNGWKYPKNEGKDFLRRLSKLALIDTVFPLPCKRCKGHRRIMRREGYSITCNRCAGYGTSNLTDRERARLLDMPYSTWNGYRRQYKNIADHVACWENDALQHIKWKL